MGLEYKYNGKTYYRNNSKWVDADYFVVPVYLQNILNTMAYQDMDLSAMSYEEAKEEGDKCKKSETYPLAIKYYECAIEKADSFKRVSVVLPRITSCYRKNKQPEKVVELLSKMKKLYGEEIINEVLLTSVAAAYCDLGEPENALKCCKWAYRVLKMNTTESSLELRNVFIRAHKMIDPDYSPEDFWEDK